VDARAGSFSFVTPSGASTGGGPVSASALITISPGSLTVQLTDLQANPQDVAQLISDFSFTLLHGDLTGATSNSLTATAPLIDVNGNGTTTPVPSGPAGWVFDNTTGTFNVLSGPGHAGPANLIIGPPGAGGVYTAANGSIAGNGPHNPFINQSVTFTVTGADITADTTVSGVVFSFGTTAGVDVPGVPGNPVPEPSTIAVALLGIGIASLSVVRRRRS
jgi:hypothetical protein